MLKTSKTFDVMTWHSSAWNKWEHSDISRVIYTRHVPHISHLVPRDFSQVLVLLLPSMMYKKMRIADVPYKYENIVYKTKPL
jgi:hypothetical protein